MSRAQAVDEQLRRYLDECPTDLDREVMRATEANGVRWTPGVKDGTQWQGLEFLRPHGRLPGLWRDAWPQSVPPPSWDIMGRIQRGGSSWERIFTWIAVTPAQVAGGCPTHAAVEVRRIEALLDRAKEAFGVPASADWMSGYFPVAQRLGVLGFLRSNGSCGRLLFTFVCGKSAGSVTQSQWRQRMAEADEHLELSGGSALERRVHRLYLPTI